MHPGVVRSSIWSSTGFANKLVSIVGIDQVQGAVPIYWLGTSFELLDKSLNGRYFVRHSPRTLPHWMNDQANADEIFRQLEHDAGMTFEQAIAA